MSWYGLTQKPIRFPQPLVTTTSLPNATVGVPYSGSGMLFSQPNITNGIATNFFVRSRPADGNFFMESLQPSITGNPWVATSFDVSSLTGFAPINPATAQMSAQNVPGTTTAQMEGGTVGAYINTNDIQNINNKMMITPDFRWSTTIFPFANQQTLSWSLSLQVPTCTGVVGSIPPIYAILDTLFMDPNGVLFSFNVVLFRMGLTRVVTATSLDAPTNNLLLTWGPGYETRFANIGPSSANSQFTTWTGYKNFSWTTNYSQFATALNVLQAAFPATTMSLLPEQWLLKELHLNAEIQIQSAPPYSLGWSMQGLTLNGTNVQLQGNGGYPPYTWAFLLDTPNTGNWLSLSPSGVLTGTPGTAETENIVVQLTDSGGNPSPPQALTLTVQSGLNIVTTSLPSVFVGSPYSATLQAQGGVQPYTWSKVSVTPNTGSWLQLNASTGALSGTPGTAEVESCVFKVTDSLGATATTNTLSLTVSAVTNQPTFLIRADGVAQGGIPAYTTFAAAVAAGQVIGNAIGEVQANTSGGSQTFTTASGVNWADFTGLNFTPGAPFTLRFRAGDTIRIIASNAFAFNCTGQTTAGTFPSANSSSYVTLDWSNAHVKIGDSDTTWTVAAPLGVTQQQGFNLRFIKDWRIIGNAADGFGATSQSVIYGGKNFSGNIIGDGNSSNILLKNLNFYLGGSNNFPAGSGVTGNCLSLYSSNTGGILVQNCQFALGGHDALVAQCVNAIFDNCTFDQYWTALSTGKPGARCTSFTPNINSDGSGQGTGFFAPGAPFGPILLHNCNWNDSDTWGASEEPEHTKFNGTNIICRGGFFADSKTGPAFISQTFAADATGHLSDPNWILMGYLRFYNNTLYNVDQWGRLTNQQDTVHVCRNSNLDMEEMWLQNNLVMNVGDVTASRGSAFAGLFLWQTTFTDANNPAVPLTMAEGTAANSFKGSQVTGNLVNFQATTTATGKSMVMQGTGGGTAQIDLPLAGWSANEPVTGVPNVSNNTIVTTSQVVMPNVGAQPQRSRAGIYPGPGSTIGIGDRPGIATVTANSSGTTLTLSDTRWLVAGWVTDAFIPEFAAYNDGFWVGTNASSAVFVQATAVNNSTKQVTITSPVTVTAGMQCWYGNSTTLWNTAGAVQGLNIATAALSNATVGTAYSSVLSASGGTAPYTWNIESLSPGKHVWLHCTAGGTLFGTPQCDSTGQGGAEVVTVRVTDSIGNTATATFNLTITVSGALSVATSSMPNATQNGGYVQQLLAQGGHPPYLFWTITAHTGSNNWFITNKGWLSGVPTVASTDTVTVQCRDAAGGTASATLTIVTNAAIQLANVDFVNNVVRLPPARVGHKYKHTLHPANGGTGTGQVFSIVNGTLPAGLTLAGSVISGTPTATGNANCSLKVVDSGSNTVTVPIYLNVSAQSKGVRPANNTATSDFFVDTTGQFCDPNGFRFQITGVNRSNFGNTGSAFTTAGANMVRFTIFGTTFRGQSGSGSTAFTTYVADAVAAHPNQYILLSNFYKPGAGGGVANNLTGGTTLTDIGLVAAYWCDNVATFNANLTGKGGVNPQNEWGPQNNSLQNVYAAEWDGPVGVGTTWKMPIASVNATTGVITLTSTAAAHPIANGALAGWIYVSGGGINKAVQISGTGGSSGAWTITPTTPSDTTGYTSGGTVSAGVVGMMRAAGYTCPLHIDAGAAFGQRWDTYSNGGPIIAQSDPLQNVMLAYHAYNTTVDYTAIISSVTTGANAVIHVNDVAALHPFNSIGQFANIPAALVRGVGGTVGINGTINVTGNGQGGSSGSWTIPTTVTTSGTNTANTGVAIPGVQTGVFGYHHVDALVLGMKAIQASGVGVTIEEFGYQNVSGASAGFTPCTYADFAQACIAAGIGYTYWAMDDTTGIGTANGNPATYTYGLTVGASNNYTLPTQLLPVGVDVILNPRYGIHCSSAPAPVFLP